MIARQKSPRRWALARLGLRSFPALLIALLFWSLNPGTTAAHEGKQPPPLSRLPACRVVDVECSLADFSRRDWGAIRPFPPPRSPGDIALAMDRWQVRDTLEPLRDVPCVDGFADIYPCHNVDLLAFIPVTDMGDVDGNTLWGWTDPDTSREYVIAGVRNGAAFFDITEPTAPIYVGKLPSHTFYSPWRDMKVYNNYAFIVADRNGPHGMQVFDLTRLRTLTGTLPITLTEDAHYAGFNEAHNIVVNEETGFLYAVGTETCNQGIHTVDIRDPLNPQAAGCYTEDGYVHDAQCVVYRGPDADHRGRELCFNASTARISVVDMDSKAAPRRISELQWQGLGYVHQGWLTADQRYFLVNDEFDELFFNHSARTYVFDMIDLDAPVLLGHYQGNSPAIDHNLYLRDPWVFEANYTAGLRILEMRNLQRARLAEVAYFDTYPGGDEPEFTGAWSPYPFFASGVVAVNTIDRGLFLLRPNLPEPLVELEVFLPLVQK
jgi:choice-of-anchor B domain-containing protein